MTNARCGNANAGESKHKEIKRTRGNACFRTGDNEVHIMKAPNDDQALRLCVMASRAGTVSRIERLGEGN